MRTLLQSKTFWTGLIAIATAGGGFAAGEMTGVDAIQTGLTGLLGIFLRAGIAKLG